MATPTRVGSRSAGGSLSALPSEIDPAAWAQVDPDALPADQRAQFMKRKRAIQMYLDHATSANIFEQTGIARSNVYRLIVERCLRPHKDGDIHGWRGALPHFRVNGYNRQKKLTVGQDGAGTSGSLQWLFASPEGRTLEQRFRKEILAKATGLASQRREKQRLFRWFIGELRSLGYERRGEWPFNVERLGYVTVSKFVDQVLAENPQRQRVILGGEDARRKAIAGDGTNRPVLGLFDRVECDAHKLDVRMVVAVPSPQGGYEMRKIHRLWVIVVLEVASRAVLGYQLSLRRECGADDVLKAVKSALSVWVPRQLQFSENAYVDGAGMPSSAAPGFVGACWNEFSVDGALANVCARVEGTLQEVVGCRILKPQGPGSYSSRRSKDDRPFIEAFFRTLTTGGFHRLAPTTGSRPADKLGADPDQAAKATQFQLEYAEELLDTLLANYNATPHTSLGYRSPLEQLRFLASQNLPIRHADVGEVRRMVGLRRLCTLLGGAETGRRPHLHFANARYSAEWLCLRTDLLGKNLWLQIENENDARWATVSDTKGLFLGVVRAAPPWHRTPHSLYVRQAIRALDKRRLIHLSSQCDAVEELIRHAESEGGKLPPHPAYLEARRILREHAETLANEETSNGLVEASPDPTPRLSAARSTPANAPTAAPEGEPDTSTKPPRAVRAIRMAKTW